MMNEKSLSKYFTGLIISSIFMLAIIFTYAPAANAQMFSVEGGGRDYNTPTVSAHIGLEAVDFEYAGKSGAGTPGVFAFEGSIIRLRVDTPNLLLSLGTGGSVTGLDNNSYLDGAIKASFGLNLIGNERIRLGLPLQLTSSLTNVSSSQFVGSQIEFRQVNVLAGAGLQLLGKASERLRVQVKAIPSYGFSTATGGSFGGSLFKLEGQARIYYDRVFGSVGLSAGYDYNFKSFNIDGNTFDYDLNSHGFLIGVTF